MNTSPLVCQLDESANFEYSSIQTAAAPNWSFVLADVKDFIEKTVFFESSDRYCSFFRFPNLVHSS